jgi:hypothetical protein
MKLASRRNPLAGSEICALLRGCAPNSYQGAERLSAYWAICALRRTARCP